jgi:NAD(P)H-dependent FMN reductase
VSADVTVLAVVGSAEGGGTDTLVGEVLAGAEERGAVTARIALGRGPYRSDEVRAELDRVGGFDALVLGTPMYRATFAGTLKAFLDDLPRAKPAEGYISPLLAKPVAVVGTGASDHHFLGIDPLVSLLPRFFAAYIVPPALYGRADAIAGGKVKDPELLDAARSLGRATTALAVAVAGDGQLAGQRPQF